MLRPSLVNGRFGDPLLFVEIPHERDTVLFDLGDVSALSARDLLRVGWVCVSHRHMDHFIGFDLLLRVHVGREKTIVLVGPEGIARAVGHRLAAYSWDLAHRYTTELVIDVRELHEAGHVRRTCFRFRSGFAPDPVLEEPAPEGLVLAGEHFELRAAILEHHGPCLGFAIEEPLQVKVWPNRVEERGWSVGPWLKALKRAVRDGLPDDAPVSAPDGSRVPLGSVRGLVSRERGQKLGYVTDVRDTPGNRAAIAKLCGGCDVLYIEASFRDDEHERARDRAHLTTTAAGEIARAAGAGRVEPFHFSPRHVDAEEAMLAEVQAAFQRGNGTLQPLRRR